MCTPARAQDRRGPTSLPALGWVSGPTERKGAAGGGGVGVTCWAMQAPKHVTCQTERVWEDGTDLSQPEQLREGDTIPYRGGRAASPPRPHPHWGQGSYPPTLTTAAAGSRSHGDGVFRLLPPGPQTPPAKPSLPRNPGGPACTRAAPVLRGNRRGGSGGLGPWLWATAKGRRSSLVLARGSGQVPPFSSLQVGISQILTQRSWVKKAQPCYGPGTQGEPGEGLQARRPLMASVLWAQWACAVSWTPFTPGWVTMDPCPGVGEGEVSALSQPPTPRFRNFPGEQEAP